MTLDHTNLSQFSIFIFTDFKPSFEATMVRAMQPILVRELFLQLIFEPSLQYWKYNIPMHRSFCFSFILIMVSTYICDKSGDASFKRIPFAFLASRNYSPNSLLLGISFFLLMDNASRSSDVGLLLPPLPPLLFKEAGATRIVEATVSRCMLESSTFFVTLFESCEPCP